MVSCATTIRKGLKFGIQFLLEITEKKVLIVYNITTKKNTNRKFRELLVMKLLRLTDNLMKSSV